MDPKILNRPYGFVEAIMGPMYAGKTSELMKKILWLNHQGLAITVIKPSIDKRYSSDEEIITHTKQSYPCINADKLSSVLQNEKNILNNSSIFIDEIQFFQIDDVKYFFGVALEHNIDIMVSGLDQDSYGIPFESSAYSLAVADNVIKLKSFCSVCGNPATKTYKKQNTGNRIDVASDDIYEPRCIKHWKPVK